MAISIPKKLAQSFYWHSEKLRGRIGVKERLAWLIETQKLDQKALKKIQLEKLNQLIHHAYESVPYYHKVFKEKNIHPDDIQSEKDLHLLPLLTRDILLNHQNDLISSKADFQTLKDNYSSGSTGKRALFKQDENFRLWMRAHQLRTYQWCHDWHIGEKFVLLWGSEIYWKSQRIQEKITNFVSNRREFNTFRLSADLISQFTGFLGLFDPVLISSYANALHLVAIEAKKQKLKMPSLRAIQTTSEPMPPEMRKRIEAIFECEIFDKYGSRETNIVSHESPAHDGMLIQSENVVVEFLNETGEVCQFNETGKVVLTTLNNFSMPLIRYETSDLASPLEGYSACYSGFERMSAVSGRKQDLIYTPKGDYIDSYFFSYLFMKFDAIHWFQVIQREYDALEILLLVPRSISKKEHHEITERIQHHTGYMFKINLNIIKEIPESPTGKFRLCVSHLKESKIFLEGTLL